jgi:hypothetical protein
MKQTMSFGSLISRIAFVVMILALVSAPQLLSINPGPIFSQVKFVLLSISFPVWLFIILIGLAFLWAVTNLQKTVGVQQAGQKPAESMPIGGAVTAQFGGNGLATNSYIPTLRILGILGWLSVSEPDKECIVIDGKQVIRRTQLYFAPMLLLGKPVNARRILLTPAPLEDIKAASLTSDQLDLTLVISVKYSISDPIYVASLSAPISELNNLITGVIVEQVHKQTLETIVKDDGTLRSMLKQSLEDSVSIKNYFKIDEVLKALPTGDERIIEIIRKTREALQKKALIEQEGQNKVLAADFDVAIQKAEAQLKEEFDQKQHIRDMEILQKQQEYEAVRELLRSIAQIAASGVNPAPAIREIRSILSETKSESVPSLPSSLPKTISLINKEQINLAELQDKIGFKSYDLQPHANKDDQPGFLIVHFNDFKLMIDCGEKYPVIAPQVTLHTNQGSISKITIPWFAGSNLTDVVTTASMQARMHKNK